jgi:hypothetical protein
MLQVVAALLKDFGATGRNSSARGEWVRPPYIQNLWKALMPQSYIKKPIRLAQVGNGPLRAVRSEPPPINPNHPPPAWVFVAGVIVVAAIIAVVAMWFRRSAYRVWKEFAASIGAEFRAADSLSPHLVSGEIRQRPFLMETATSHEDDAGYFHTRGRVPIKNTGSFILGLRRKSLLETAQTRGETGLYELDDSEFQRQFFLYCNDADNLAQVLTPEARRELLRYHDVEIYVRMGEMEWRRAGEQSDLKAIRRLTDLVLDMAETIDRFPSRGRSLTQLLADEKTIEKGV